MGRSRRLLLVAGLLATVVAAVGPQPGAPCEPTLLAAQVALFCAPGVPTAQCCDSVDLGVPCLCRVAAEPQLVTAGLNATHLLTLYSSCGGLRPGGAHLAAACEGPAPPAAVVSSLRPPAPASPAPRRTQTAHDAPPPPQSSEKPSSPPPAQEHAGAAPHAKVAPAQPSTSPLAPAAATAPPPLPRHSAAAASKAAFIFVATAMRMNLLPLSLLHWTNSPCCSRQQPPTSLAHQAASSAIAVAV
ncbi:predicted GPI-anchored protein 58 [Triticum dicoccoides]|uniref:predicted GPI-anchored protein 58 n=1 Tax=Triticum dicoccoides TaxID=85692 RepID=UPI00188F8404|nr:predicted GPI-anchored protein 58 [Triticum dicoccoides]XP_044367368.1 non-specific lipid-transfer protein EPAD1-like [Triticum aestivum]